MTLKAIALIIKSEVQEAQNKLRRERERIADEARAAWDRPEDITKVVRDPSLCTCPNGPFRYKDDAELVEEFNEAFETYERLRQEDLGNEGCIHMYHGKFLAPVRRADA